jgi:CelD/BcsL family acetyltransferase involved in cellulose biosynthesis
MQARIKPVSNSCMYVSVCDRSCFTTVKKRTTTGVQQRQEQKKKKRRKKRTTSKIGDTKRTKNMSTSLENQRKIEKKR